MPRVWVGRLLIAVVLASATNVVLSGLEVEHDGPLVALLAAGTVAAAVLALAALETGARVPWLAPRRDVRPDPGEDARTAMFRHLVDAHETSREADDAVLWQLAELAARRLRQLHGLRYADDPERVTELVGPVLGELLSHDRRDRYQTGRPAPPLRHPGARRPGAQDRGAVTDPSVSAAAERAAAVLQRVESLVIGKSEALRLVLAGVLAGGHVLLEDFPGLGKTLAARSFAQALGIEFTRAQFTPDLLPADLTGSFIYNQRTAEFEFRPGPLFTGLLLADEINRTPPKTQAALLEAMQERQVTVEGRTFPLAPPFHVLATANPVEYEGTYPLPEAQLDRFLLRVGFGYPTQEEEYDVLRSRIARQREDAVLEPVTDAAGLLAMQQAVEQVEVDRSVGEYCVSLVAASRSHRDVMIGASPRGSLALMLCGRALALILGRDFVLPEDVKTVAPAVLSHRITVKPELWMTDVSGTAVVDAILASVPTPSARERTRP